MAFDDLFQNVQTTGLLLPRTISVAGDGVQCTVGSDGDKINGVEKIKRHILGKTARDASLSSGPTT